MLNLLDMKHKHYFRMVVSFSLVLAVAIPLWFASPVILVHAQGYGGGGGGVGGVDRTPPRISDISLSNIAKTTTDVYWRTQEKSDTHVEYRSNPSMFSELDEERVINHHISLTGLTPATTYYYKTMSRDRSGNLAVSDEYTFTTLGTPATFTTSIPTISPTEVDIGENINISAVVANTGDAPGTYEVTLKIDDAVAATKEVTLAGGTSQTVTFTIYKDVAKTYSVSINSLSGSFVVKPPPPPPAPPPPTPPPPVPPPPVPPPVLPPPPKLINWWLIGGIIAAFVASGVFIWLNVIRQRD